MNTNQQTFAFLGRAALLAMLLLVAPAAFADPPGYLFKDIEPNTQAVVSIPQQPQHATAANTALSTAQAHRVCAILGVDASADAPCVANLERLSAQSFVAQRRSE